MRIISLFVILLSISCSTKSISSTPSRTDVLRDVEGYAIASCLTFQSQPYLKDQGDAWASVIIQRMKGSPAVLFDIIEKVKTEIKKGNMTTIRDETNLKQDKVLPIFFCSEIIDVPDIRS